MVASELSHMDVEARVVVPQLDVSCLDKARDHWHFASMEDRARLYWRDRNSFSTFESQLASGSHWVAGELLSNEKNLFHKRIEFPVEGTRCLAIATTNGS